VIKPNCRPRGRPSEGRRHSKFNSKSQQKLTKKQTKAPNRTVLNQPQEKEKNSYSRQQVRNYNNFIITFIVCCFNIKKINEIMQVLS
jgi:hypothetical protein